MKLIALKTEDGKSKGDIAFYCRVLHVSRQGFYQYLANKDRAWKYQPLADAMLEILAEDECNDTYGRIRMYQALNLKQLQNVDIPVSARFIASWKKSGSVIVPGASRTGSRGQTGKPISQTIS